jgi:hypothetical protein
MEEGINFPGEHVKKSRRIASPPYGHETDRFSFSMSYCVSLYVNAVSILNSKEGMTLRTRRRVLFDQVVVHYHPTTLGDNPSVSRGPPVTIDWKPIHSESFPLDAFEGASRAKRGTDQRRKPMKLSKDARVAMLMLQGHSLSEMSVVETEMNTIKTSRRQTRSANSKDARVPLRKLQGIAHSTRNLVESEKRTIKATSRQTLPSNGDLVAAGGKESKQPEIKSLEKRSCSALFRTKFLTKSRRSRSSSHLTHCPGCTY